MKSMAEKKEIMSQDNISLKLANYNDIFSSFDPRPYSERSLSVDFLSEAKRASIDKPSGGLELRLLLPEAQRKPETERVIRKRLKAHFERHAKKVRSQHNKVVRTGLSFTTAGIIIMIIATLILFSYPESNLFFNFLIILFEPAGWFLFWEGLDLMLFESKKTCPEMDFYKKMTKTDIIFLSF